MAGEITMTLGLNVEKGSLAIDKNPQPWSIDMTGDAYSSGTQSIGVGAHSLLSFSAPVANGGIVFFINLDETNSVEVGGDNGGTFVPVVKLLAGEGALFRAATKSLYAKATGGTCILEHVLVEE